MRPRGLLDLCIAPQGFRWVSATLGVCASVARALAEALASAGCEGGGGADQRAPGTWVS